MSFADTNTLPETFIPVSTAQAQWNKALGLPPPPNMYRSAPLFHIAPPIRIEPLAPRLPAVTAQEAPNASSSTIVPEVATASSSAETKTDSMQRKSRSRSRSPKGKDAARSRSRSRSRGRSASPGPSSSVQKPLPEKSGNGRPVTYSMTFAELRQNCSEFVDHSRDNRTVCDVYDRERRLWVVSGTIEEIVQRAENLFCHVTTSGQETFTLCAKMPSMSVWAKRSMEMEWGITATDAKLTDLPEKYVVLQGGRRSILEALRESLQKNNWFYAPVRRFKERYSLPTAAWEANLKAGLVSALRKKHQCFIEEVRPHKAHNKPRVQIDIQGLFKTALELRAIESLLARDPQS